MAVGTRSNEIPNNFVIGTPIFPLRYENVTPSNSAVFQDPVAIEIWDAGAIVVSPYGGNADQTLTITAGMVSSGPFLLRFMVRAVKATGTTSTIIKGIW